MKAGRVAGLCIICEPRREAGEGCHGEAGGALPPSTRSTEAAETVPVTQADERNLGYSVGPCRAQPEIPQEEELPVIFLLETKQLFDFSQENVQLLEINSLYLHISTSPNPLSAI